MKTIYQTLTVITLLILIWIFQDWIRTFTITSLGGYTKKETVTVIDTKFVKGKIDTLAVFNNYVETAGIVLNPEAKIIYMSTEKEPSVMDSLKKFKVKVSDSLIDGTITVKNKFNGDLFLASFNYKPLFPKYITRTDTVFKSTTISETLSKERSKFGIGTGYDWIEKDIQLLFSYTAKNDWQFIYEYETGLTKEFLTEIPKRANHSIKIIKNF